MHEQAKGSLLCLMLLFTAMPVHAPPSQAGAPGESKQAEAIPFSNVERLIYSVRWDPPWFLSFLPAMEAGEAELRMMGETEYKGRKAVKISFTARSSGILMSLSGVKIDDDFAFISEPETFCTLSVSKKVREGKRKRQINVDYLRETRQLHIRELDESFDPPKLKRDELKENIPACAQDPLSALYLLRKSPLHVDYVQTSWIANDDMIKEVQSRVEKQENVDAPIGKFQAWRINTVALMGGLFREGGEFQIWLSADEAKVPLQFEVKVKLGRVFGKLKLIQR